MKLESLKNFDAQKTAKLETKMWKVYYARNFLKLFLFLIKLMHEVFRLNYLKSLRAAIYSALAASDFSKNKGQENKERITRRLRNFFEIISNNSIEKFNYEKAAESEMAWWMVDRYPDRYQTSRRQALGEAAAILYSIEPAKLSEYANYRATAMELLDEIGDEKEANWPEVEENLTLAFESLHKAVN